MLKETDIIKKIKLSYPIPYLNSEGNRIDINEVSIGRLKAKHLHSLPSCITENFGSSNKKKTNISPKEFIPFIAAITELPIETIDELDFGDLMEIVDVLVDSLGVKEQGK